METEVREVDFEDALKEEAGEQEEAPSRPRPQIQSESPEETTEESQAKQQLKDDLELLAPKTAAREWTFGPSGQSRTYIQRELSVTGSAQWFGLVGEVLESALSGDNALSLNSLLAMPTPRTPGQISLTDFQDADMFVHALGKLLIHAPKFLEKSVCIWLAVPDYEWEYVAELMRLSPSEGGMSHDMFEEILETFIDQNYPEIDRFFRVRYLRLRASWQARAKEAGQSRSSQR
jgi:hypothetical protein